jgi:hypothetical protein
MLQRLRRRPALAGWSKPTPIRDQGAKAYRKGRQRERDVILPDGTTHAGRTPAHWRRVALMVARMMASESASAPLRGCSSRATNDENVRRALDGLTFSALYAIYVVVQIRLDLYRRVQPIDIGLTKY